jgi:hypothetical protein
VTFGSWKGFTNGVSPSSTVDQLKEYAKTNEIDLSVKSQRRHKISDRDLVWRPTNETK